MARRSSGHAVCVRLVPKTGALASLGGPLRRAMTKTKKSESGAEGLSARPPSQFPAAFFLDLVERAVDCGQLVGRHADEFFRHAAGDGAVGVVFADQHAVRGTHFFVACVI